MTRPEAPDKKTSRWIGWCVLLAVVLIALSIPDSEKPSNPVVRYSPNDDWYQNALTDEDYLRAKAGREQARLALQEAEQKRHEELLLSATPAAVLTRAFDLNPVRVTRQFGGKRIVVFGVVESIREGFAGDAILNLTGYDQFSYVASSFLSAEAVLDVNVGQEVHVHCAELSNAMGHPFLARCELL